VKEYLNVIGGYIWVLGDTVLYVSAEARQLTDSSTQRIQRASRSCARIQGPRRER
jgi:hypothetical protein